MRKKKIVFIALALVLLGVLMFAIVNNSQVQKASFVNLEPTLILNEIEYEVTDSEIDIKDIGSKIAIVSQISNVVSYSDDNNPYRSVDDVHEIKGKKIEEHVAVRINGTYFLAEVN